MKCCGSNKFCSPLSLHSDPHPRPPFRGYTFNKSFTRLNEPPLFSLTHSRVLCLHPPTLNGVGVGGVSQIYIYLFSNPSNSLATGQISEIRPRANAKGCKDRHNDNNNISEWVYYTSDEHPFFFRHKAAATNGLNQCLLQLAMAHTH